MGQVILPDGAPDLFGLFQVGTGKQDTVQCTDRGPRNTLYFPDQTGPLQPPPDPDLKGALCPSSGQDQSIFPLRDFLKGLICKDNIIEQTDDFLCASFQTDRVIFTQDQKIIVPMEINSPSVRQQILPVKTFLIVLVLADCDPFCFLPASIMNRTGVPVNAEFIELPGGKILQSRNAMVFRHI